MQESGGDGGGWWPERDPPSDKQGSRPDPDDPEERRPPRGLASEKSSRSPSRYSMFVGLAFFALILVALFNLIGGTDQTGILGDSYGDDGTPLPEFAAPSVAGTSDADANVAQDDCENSLNPCPDDEERTPACQIDADEPGAEAIRVCDLFDKPLAISFWFTKGGDCIPSQDAFDRVARSYRGRVNFLSMDVRDDRKTVEEIVAGGDWQVPVGLDPDGAVSNLYRVGVCPTVVLAYPGGILHSAEIKPGNFTDEELTGFIDDLLVATRERAEQSR